jgi:predicted outer membrane repeat protein
MAVTFDTFATSASNASTSPLAWAQTCGASADWILAAFALDGGSGITPANNPLTATYNSVSMASKLNWQSGGSGQTAGYLAVLALQNPLTGSSANVSGSFTATGVDAAIAGSASVVSGGGTLGTPVHSDSAGSAVASGSITVTGSTSGSLVAVFVTNGSGGTSFTTGTSRFTNNHATGGGGAISSNCATIAGTGGSVTVNWTQNSDFYAAIAIEVLPGASGPPLMPPVQAWPIYQQRIR